VAGQVFARKLGMPGMAMPLWIDRASPGRASAAGAASSHWSFGSGAPVLERGRLDGIGGRSVCEWGSAVGAAAYRANGSAGNTRSSRSDSAWSTLMSRMIASASTATSRVTPSAGWLASRSRARSQSLRASADRPR
jgi:hypothetical protein